MIRTTRDACYGWVEACAMGVVAKSLTIEMVVDHESGRVLMPLEFDVVNPASGVDHPLCVKRSYLFPGTSLDGVIVSGHGGQVTNLIISFSAYGASVGQTGHPF